MTLLKELSHKSLLKVIAGLNNFDLQSVNQISEADSLGGADFIDIACNPDLVESGNKIVSFSLN